MKNINIKKYLSGWGIVGVLGVMLVIGVVMFSGAGRLDWLLGGEVRKEPSGYGETYENATEEQLEAAEQASVNEKVMAEIAENYFQAEFNLREKVVVTRGETMKIADFLGIAEPEVENLIEKGAMAVYLDANLPGRYTENEDTVEMYNPFYTDRLLVQVTNEGLLAGAEVSHLTGDFYAVKYASAMETEEKYEELRVMQAVKNIAVDQEMEVSDLYGMDATTQSVNDEYLSWGVDTMGMNLYTAKMEMLDTENEVRVAVLDTGIQRCHEVFTTDEETAADCAAEDADRVDYTGAYDYVNGDSDPADDNGHGTKVSAVVVEATPENVKVVPVKVMNGAGRGSLVTIMQAVATVADEVEVINLSLGQSPSTVSSADMATYEALFKTVKDGGTIVVAATGNGDEDGVALNEVDYPASSAYTVAVGAVEYSGAIATFSNYGAEVDFAAPGVGMYLPKCYDEDEAEAGTACDSLDGYEGGSGTSFATPFIAAAVAMIRLEDRNVSYADTYNILKENAVIPASEGSVAKSEHFGYGSVSFANEMFATPVIVKLEAMKDSETGVTTVEAGAVSNTYIGYFAITDDETEPTEWDSYDRRYAYKMINTSHEIEKEDGTYYYWVKDLDGNVAQKSFLVATPAEDEPLSDTAGMGMKMDVAEWLSVAALDPETEAALRTISLEVDPDKALHTKEVLVRVDGNTYYNLLISTASDETSLTRSDKRAEIEKTTYGGASDETFEVNTWGYAVKLGTSVAETDFRAVPVLGEPSTLVSGVYPTGTGGTTVVFGVKADTTLLAGDYTNTVVFTVLPGLMGN